MRKRKGESEHSAVGEGAVVTGEGRIGLGRIGLGATGLGVLTLDGFGEGAVVIGGLGRVGLGATGLRVLAGLAVGVSYSMEKKRKT